MATQTARVVLDRLVEAYPRSADPERAVSMSAYMRDQFPFLGLDATTQRAVARTVLTGIRPTEVDLVDVAGGCWELPEREYQQFACSWLRRTVKICSPQFLDTARHLIVTKSWWDTVDSLAAHVVGALVDRHPALVSTMDEWIVDENMWLARTALLHQLTYREKTDAQRLFSYCSLQAGHTDFFIRKAIGWALRQYARTDPVAVADYVDRHEHDLSGLSVREARKHL